jgi:secondary thiamine-phosphate synthase enzyme
MCIQPAASAPANFAVHTERVTLRTQRSQQFVDITELVAQRVRRSGITHGLLNVQSCHTTASILVNEFEPELLRDIAELAEQWAPRKNGYRHDHRDEMPPEERANGHAHARAILLGTSTVLNVEAGSISLGRWQRIVLAELDGPREREISIVVMGAGETRPERAARWPSRAALGGRGA